MTLRLLSCLRYTFILALHLITGPLFTYNAMRSVAGETRLRLFPFLSPTSLSFPRSVHCLPVTQTRRINTPAQPWRKLGNCGPHLSLLSRVRLCACYDSHPTDTNAPDSELYVSPPPVTTDRLRHRAALSRRHIPDDGRATPPRAPFLKPPYLSVLDSFGNAVRTSHL